MFALVISNQLLIHYIHASLCYIYSLQLHFSTLEEYEMAGTCCSHSAKSNCKDSCTLVCSVGMLWLRSLQWLLGLLSTWGLYWLKNDNACSNCVSIITKPVLPSNLFSSYPGLPCCQPIYTTRLKIWCLITFLMHAQEEWIRLEINFISATVDQLKFVPALVMWHYILVWLWLNAAYSL